MTTVNTSYRGIWRSLKITSPAFAAVLLVAGCMPQPDNSAGSAEEYQYKGKADQLMDEPAANRAGKLSERFKLIQARQ